MTRFSLDGKTILVTGASSGIGKTLAIELSKQDACVIVTGRNKDRLENTLKSLKGDYHKLVLANLTIREEVVQLATQMPQINGVVFCAGMIDYSPAKHIDAEKMHEVFQINFESQIALYQALHLNKKLLPGASLVFISSVSSLAAVPATLVYSASKAAISASVKVLASELAKNKIRVNSISPGLIKTPLFDNEIIEDETLAKNEAMYPLGLGESIDVANAAIFLLSEETRWITGINLVVDGGYMLHR